MAERKPTWFKQRMDELGLSYEDVANAVDRDMVTIRTDSQSTKQTGYNCDGYYITREYSY